MTRIVSIKFRTAGKHYDFNAGNLTLAPGEQVIVETDRGRALGIVVNQPRELPEGETPERLKNVLRPASNMDLALAADSAGKEKEAFRFCLERIQARRMEMKLIRAEYLFDASKIIFYFTADGRVDFRELVKDLAHHFHTRIEMRQIGVRDEAKLIGGLGVCGRPLCCCTFLTNFAPVSVKMAKEQGLALNPNKISGQCGRLLCCLNYEFDLYTTLRKKLPKCGCRVMVENKQGEVTGQNILEQTVTVRLEDKQIVNVPVDKLKRPEKSAKPTAAAGKPAGRPEKAGKDRPSGGESKKSPGSGKGRKASAGKSSPRRRGRNPAQANQPAAEGDQSPPRRPRRKRSNRRRSPKNTTSGDKK
jgi:cell fate regulator YaaT (PSP1 superfamily)